ncbi:hypothetical protein [Tolypothrix sp. VBCCA 56010]|uniref:hypothetical protein n=1 Tax=Tolypothrix sp. VBCCA 56010 TaxID=3137731 RepID=UPI003D7CC106
MMHKNKAFSPYDYYHLGTLLDRLARLDSATVRRTESSTNVHVAQLCFAQMPMAKQRERHFFKNASAVYGRSRL